MASMMMNSQRHLLLRQSHYRPGLTNTSALPASRQPSSARLAASTPSLALRLPPRRLASSSSSPLPVGGGAAAASDNEFNRSRQAVKAHAAASSDLWRKLSIYVVIPSLVLASINAWNLWQEHWEHWAHLPPLEERTQYPYQNIRTKNFFWGDGDKTLFWNPKVNYNKRDE